MRCNTCGRTSLSLVGSGTELRDPDAGSRTRGAGRSGRIRVGVSDDELIELHRDALGVAGRGRPNVRRRVGARLARRRPPSPRRLLRRCCSRRLGSRRTRRPSSRGSTTASGHTIIGVAVRTPRRRARPRSRHLPDRQQRGVPRRHLRAIGLASGLFHDLAVDGLDLGRRRTARAPGSDRRDAEGADHDDPLGVPWRATRSSS